MTTAEDNAIEEFVLGAGRNVKAAIAVHKLWPGIKEKICSDFLEEIRGNLSKDMESRWSKVEISAAYSERRYESWICVYLNHWRKDEDGDPTSISLQTQGKGPNHWMIGVYSPLLLKDMREEGRSLHEELAKRFGDRGNPPTEYYSWWKRVDEEYRHWDSLIPEIHQELQKEGGGEIMRYFVEEFVRIAKGAIPIINRIEGGES